MFFDNGDSKRSVVRASDDGKRESNDLYWWFGECNAFRRNAQYVFNLEQHHSEWNLQYIKWVLF